MACKPLSSYARIVEKPGLAVFMCPIEEDGTLLLSRLKSRFFNATGLKFQMIMQFATTRSMLWIGVRLHTKGYGKSKYKVFQAPLEGWGDREYVVIFDAKEHKLGDGDTSGKTTKETLSDLVVLGLPYSATDDDLKTYFMKFGTLKRYEITLDTQTKKSKGFGFIQYISAEVQQQVLSTSHNLGGNNLVVRKHNPLGDSYISGSDLIVLGLPYSATNDDLKTYFMKFGTLNHYEIRLDTQTKKSRGFGFIRYTSVEVQQQVLARSDLKLGGRNLEVRFPNKEGLDNIPTKVCIGGLPNGTTVDDLKDCFYEYAPLVDAYIHKHNHFFAVGYVTFDSQLDAREAVNSTRVIKGNVVTMNLM